MTRDRDYRGVTDTRSEAERRALLADGLLYGLEGLDPSLAIELQEKRGQTELVASEVLPNPDQKHEPRTPFEAIGVVFGEPVPGDPLFIQVQLPAGWTRKATDHSMWSYVVDEHGEERISVGYKAAFYDRWASMHVIALCSACPHSAEAHPYTGNSEDASAANGWRSTPAPRPCVREGCDCAALAVAS